MSSPRIDAETRIRLDLWTEVETERLKALWADPDILSAEIAQILKKTRSAVIGRAHRLGLSHRTKFTYVPAAKTVPERKHGINRVKKAKAIPLPKQRPEALMPSKGKGKKLLDLKLGMCKWPIGDPANRDTFLYCGAAAIDVYCACHQSISRQPAPSPTRIFVRGFR